MLVTSATLNTVADYLAEARLLLQDLVLPYRYLDADLVAGLNIGLTEAFRIRPDIFLMARYEIKFLPQTVGSTLAVPTFTAASPADVVPLPVGYRVPLLYYVLGNAQLKDDELTQDARATIFLNKFISQLTGTKA